MHRLRRTALLTIAAFGFACGSSEDGPTDSGQPPADSGQPSPDAGAPDTGVEDAGEADAGEPACPPPAREDEEGVCRAEIADWLEGPMLPRGVDHHATLVTTGTAGAFLHAVGGNDYSRVYATTHSARIGEDGVPGEWSAGPNLPSARAGTGVANTGRYVVLTGGRAFGQPDFTEVLVAPVLESGRLGAWRVGPALPSHRFHGSAEHHQGRIYAVGGLYTGTATSTVLVADLSAEGELSPWRPVRSMPGPRSHHASLVRDGHLYVIAGLSGDPTTANVGPLTDILRAEILPDGELGEWVEVGRLPRAFGTHAAVVVGDEAWILGGVVDNATFTDTILRGQLHADGRAGPFTELTRLPRARSHVHQTPVHGRYLYSVGGSNRRVMQPSMDVAILE